MAAAASRYADMPLSRVLFRYVWPFWLFKDATRGDRYRARGGVSTQPRHAHPSARLSVRMGAGERAARSESQAASARCPLPHAGTVDVFAVLAAGWGIAFACCLCVLFVTSYIYLYLSRHMIWQADACACGPGPATA